MRSSLLPICFFFGEIDLRYSVLNSVFLTLFCSYTWTCSLYIYMWMCLRYVWMYLFTWPSRRGGFDKETWSISLYLFKVNLSFYNFIGINNTVLVLSSYYFRNVASRLTTTGNNEISKRSSEFNCYNQKHICYHPNVCVYNFTKLMVEKCEKQHFRLLIISLVDIYMDWTLKPCLIVQMPINFTT